MIGGRGASSFETRVADWLTVDDARNRILWAAHPLPPDDVAARDAVGRALYETVLAPATLPPWDNSAMDGYAVRAVDVSGASGDTPVTLPVDSVVHAGSSPAGTLQPGHAVRIMTGAPVPTGADTVVRVEDTDGEQEPGRVRIHSDRDQNRNVRAAGQDMRAGTALFGPGQAITPGVLGVLAAAGHSTVRVHRAPRVALLPTGDELRRLDRYDDVRAGRGVPESNTQMLSAMIAAVGAHPIDLGIALDRVEDIAGKIATASDADVLVTIGGASMGEADLVKRALDGAGFEQDFWRVTMRPGSPISFGWLTREDRRQAVFGLPGNPSSAFVTFEVFVRPFLLRLAGHARILRRTVPCTMAERMSTPAALTYFQRVRIEEDGGELRAWLTGPQVSGLVSGLARADGLAVVTPERDSVEVGDVVSVILLDQGPGAVAAVLP
jgi:molybdopterin molybdotransferase